MKRFYPKFRQWGITTALAFFLVFGCVQDPQVPVDEDVDYSHLNLTGDVALEWFQLFLELERFTPGYKVPIAGRTWAMVALSGYEAVNPGYSNQYGSIAREFSGLDIPKHFSDYEYDWEIVLNSALETSFDHFFRTAPTSLQVKMDNLANRIYSRLNRGVNSKVRYRSQSYGKKVADAVYTWSAKDKVGHEAYLQPFDPNYIPPGGNGKWSPTYPDYLSAMLPRWGSAFAFVSDKYDRVDPPLPYSADPKSELYQQALETYHIVNKIKEGKLYEDKWIADFWSDDCPILTFTPSGRWMSITNQLFAHKSQPLDVTLALYTKLGIAMNDAGVRSWGEKYRLNVLRPVEYIQNVIDKDWNTVMCPDGSGNFYTPPFPTYPSGHATFAGAAAEVLSQGMGYYYEMTDYSHKGRTEFIGTPRHFDSFREMAAENAYSRIPIGVHFRMDAEAGLDLGKRIGMMVIKDISWMKYSN